MGRTFTDAHTLPAVVPALMADPDADLMQTLMQARCQGRWGDRTRVIGADNTTWRGFDQGAWPLR